MRTKVRTILDCTPELDPSWPGGLEEGSEGRLVDSMREREVLVRTIDVLNLGATLTKELDDQLLTTLGLIVEETGRVGLREIMLGRDDYHAFGHWLGPSAGARRYLLRGGGRYAREGENNQPRRRAAFIFFRRSATHITRTQVRNTHTHLFDQAQPRW